MSDRRISEAFRLTDSHCHLAMLPPDRSAGVLERARRSGVAGFVVPGTLLEDSERAVTLAGEVPGVWSAVGFHPHEAQRFSDAAMDRLRQLALRDEVVAIGEMGLDYHYMHSPREVQREVFLRQIALAFDTDLPLIIHNREATDDLVELLGTEDARNSRGILHSFTESYELARSLIDRGFFISFSGILTFRSAQSLREVATRLPIDAVLIETDTPYLAPVPHRGKENEPGYVGRIAETLAQLWNLPIDRVAEQTTTNFERAFGVSVPR